MLTEVKYNPNSDKPYTVLKKTQSGWSSLGAYTDESTAIALAQKISLEPDMPCLIRRFSNGVCVNESN